MAVVADGEPSLRGGCEGGGVDLSVATEDDGRADVLWCSQERVESPCHTLFAASDLSERRSRQGLALDDEAVGRPIAVLLCAYGAAIVFEKQDAEAVRVGDECVDRCTFDGVVGNDDAVFVAVLIGFLQRLADLLK